MIVRKNLPQPNASGNVSIVKVDIYAIDELASAIYCYGVDDQDEVCSESFTLYYKGTGKNVPFSLTKAEIAEIKS